VAQGRGPMSSLYRLVHERIGVLIICNKLVPERIVVLIICSRWVLVELKDYKL